ncbi:MAG: hypothetical protein L6244_06990 [Candidatus Methanoperedenaceae archaeon]|nr:hypothetical protein [Euryarchaeota archaeon]MCG2728373.1 hypothetical protein [Candidatus Methanoperedenaceae archaeon]
MVRGLATKPTRIGSDKIYLRKAMEFLEGARLLAEKEKWNSSAVLSVHAVISACDAVCSRFLQLRHGGADHMQARRVISLKNAAEYEDKLIKQSDAQEMQKEAGRLVEWAGKIVK